MEEFVTLISFWLLVLGCWWYLDFNIFWITKFRKKCLWIFIAVAQIMSVLMLKHQVGDVMLFAGAGNYLRRGIDFYWIDSDHSQYPFFPVMIFAYAGLSWIQEQIKVVTFIALVKLFMNLPSLWLVAWWIKKQAKDKNDGFKQATLFLMHPITVGVVLYHGQTDIIVMAFLLWGMTLISQKKLSGIMMWSLSVGIKTWSIVTGPLILLLYGWRQALKTAVFTLLFLGTDIFLYTRLVFGSAFRVVIPAIGQAGGAVGVWGWSKLAEAFGVSNETLMTLRLPLFSLLLAVIYLMIILKKITDWRLGICLLLLGIILIVPNFGVQYLMWFLPALILWLPKLSNLIQIQFHLLASIFTILSYLYISSGYKLDLVHEVEVIGVILWVSIGLVWIKLFYLKKYEI